MVYSIDLETMVQILQEHRQTGMLQATLPNGVAAIKEPCRVEIDVAMGKIAACRIENNSGRIVLWGDDALREVYRLGILDWNLELQRETPLSVRDTSPSLRTPATTPLRNAPASFPQERTSTGSIPTVWSSLVPRRIFQVEPAQMISWPRTHRMVYALVDGKNTMKKIVGMLSLSPSTVEQVLRDLESMNVIVIGK